MSIVGGYFLLPEESKEHFDSAQLRAMETKELHEVFVQAALTASNLLEERGFRTRTDS